MKDSTAIVVSTENSQYMAWQTMLFCSSSLTTLGKAPIVVVHSDICQLRSEFDELRLWGCDVVLAPSFRAHPLGDYPARNELGSLSVIEAVLPPSVTHILFCEADMLIIKKPYYPDALCGEYYDYLQYGEKRIIRVANKFGLKDGSEMLDELYSVGVPYYIPKRLIGSLASRWLQVLDSFDEVKWIDIMYAFGIAVADCGLPIFMSSQVDLNKRNEDPCVRSIIHYCYGDDNWGKRLFIDESPIEQFSSTIRDGIQRDSILDVIIHHIEQVRIRRGLGNTTSTDEATVGKLRNLNRSLSDQGDS